MNGKRGSALEEVSTGIDLIASDSALAQQSVIALPHAGCPFQPRFLMSVQLMAATTPEYMPTNVLGGGAAKVGQLNTGSVRAMALQPIPRLRGNGVA